jgi:uncharacterized protein YbjT (DUF2867 family)
MSRFVVFGSAGTLGSRVVAEAVGRRRQVIAAVRELGGVTVSDEVEVCARRYDVPRLGR